MLIHHQLTDIWVISTLWPYDQCCYEHAYTSFRVDVWFQFNAPRSGSTGWYGNSMSNILRNSCSILHSRHFLHILTDICY